MSEFVTYLGASSTTFWFLLWMEHSLSFSHRAFPCLSASTCNKHTERPGYLWWMRGDLWFTVNNHDDPLISSVIIETIYPNHTFQKNIAFTWRTSGSGILQRIPPRTLCVHVSRTCISMCLGLSMYFSMSSLSSPKLDAASWDENRKPSL